MTLQWRAIQRKTKPEIDWDQIWWAPPPTLSFSFRFIFLWRLCLDWNQNQSKISRIHRKYERMLTLFLCSKPNDVGWLHFWSPVEFSRSKKNARSFEYESNASLLNVEFSRSKKNTRIWKWYKSVSWWKIFLVEGSEVSTPVCPLLPQQATPQQAFY